MSNDSVSEAAKAVVRRNTDEVQGQGKFDVFDELFADDFVDHTTQPGTTPDKGRSSAKLYGYLREAFPDFTRSSTGSSPITTRDDVQDLLRHARRRVSGNCPYASQDQFETVDVMRVQNGRSQTTGASVIC